MLTHFKTLKVINPAAAAAVMAIGIFLFAAIDKIPILNDVAILLVIPYILVALFIFLSIFVQVLQPDFITPFIKNPVNSFVMGSWIAGVSVVCNVVLKFSPDADDFIFGITVINSIVFLLFLFFYLRNFWRLLIEPCKHEVHGVVLLSTVSTQSIVILWVELVPSLSRMLVAVGIGMGLCFYIVGISLIFLRYLRSNEWSLSEDWTNTNCIIHGALSISGLALVLSHSGSPGFILLYWQSVFFLFALIESFELARAVIRVKKYGWRKGLFTYQVSQWSRNFTFGMFYAFTLSLGNDPFYAGVHLPFQTFFLPILAWIVFLLLMVEICLWIYIKMPHKNGETDSLSKA
jgi:hypothetical protein